jgi:hypothetical protein
MRELRKAEVVMPQIQSEIRPIQEQVSREMHIAGLEGTRTQLNEYMRSKANQRVRRLPPARATRAHPPHRSTCAGSSC